MTLLRSEQYAAALADDRAFQRRYMLGVEVPAGKRQTRLVEQDEGVHQTTAEGLAKLRPVREGGTVTFGSQTHISLRRRKVVFPLSLAGERIRMKAKVRSLFQPSMSSERFHSGVSIVMVSRPWLESPRRALFALSMRSWRLGSAPAAEAGPASSSAMITAFMAGILL